MSMPAISIDLVTGFISFFLTIMVLSYLIGDNPFFRLALYIFVGVSAGYTASMAWHQVLLPKVFIPLASGSALDRFMAVIPFSLGMMLFMKLSPRFARLGNPSMALMVGVGAAVALGGAVLGTLLPLAQATMSLPAYHEIISDIGTTRVTLVRFVEGLFVILGTISTLVYFHFGAKATPSGPQRNRLVQLFATIGQVFIAVAFGTIYAGVLAAAMTVLIERINSLWMFLSSFF